MILSASVATVILAATSLAALGAPGSAVGTEASPGAKLSRLLEQFVRAHPGFPGVALAVRTPTISWSGAAGLASRAPRRPLRARAGFRIASVTKTFTAAAILRLAEDGRLSLDDPLPKHLSQSSVVLLRRGGYKVEAIRVRNLLQHTSGLYDYAEDQAYQAFVVGHPHHRWARAEQVRFAVAHGKPLFAPGTSFHYSDTGYVLLGEILERVTGRGLAAAYQTYLETLERKPPGAAARAHQYLGTIDTTNFDPSFDLYGGGGLVSTVDDLANFYRALFGGRVFRRAATLRTMLGKPQSARPNDLGMGIFAESLGRATCWHHDGFWGTTVLHCPHGDLTIAITVNQANRFDTATQQLAARVVRLLGR